MKPLLTSVRENYARQLREHGDAPQATHQNDPVTMELRYARLLRQLLPVEGAFSIHDVGCGLCDLHGYLEKEGIEHDYSGTDIVPEMIELAAAKHPDLSLHARELSEAVDERYDFVVLSGTLNIPAQADRAAWGEYCKELVGTMYALCNRAISFNMLSTHNSFTDPELFYIDPWAMAAHCIETHSRFVTVDHGYPLFEATITIHRPEHVRTMHPEPELAKYFPKKVSPR